MGMELGILIALQRSFKEKRLLANGLVASGTGFGMLVMAPVIQILLSMYSVHGTLLIFSGIALNGTVLGFLILYSLPRDKVKITKEKNVLMDNPVQEKDPIDPGKKKTVPDYQGTEHSPETPKVKISTDQQTKSDWRDLLNNKAYYMFTIGSVLSHTSMKTVLGITIFLHIFPSLPFCTHLTL